MDDFVRRVRGAEDWDVDKLRKDLLPAIKSATVNLLLSPVSDGQDPLHVLHPERHTLGYLFVLVARMRAVNPDAPPLLRFALHFAENFNVDHAKMAPEQMKAFGQGVARLAEKAERHIAAVRPLQVACIRWSAPDGGHLTPLHPLLCKQCLLAKTPRAALPILDRDITDVEPHTFDLVYQDFLLHHYYGGMIYLALKRYERAMQCFKLCIVAPGYVTSAVQVEAHRKYVLVCLLAYGRFIPLPKYINSSISRACKQYGAAYLDFAQAYESLNVGRIEAEARKNEQPFRASGNRGLVLQCLQLLVRRNIQQLTETYLTLSLGDIAKSVNLSGPEEAERNVLRMIEEGQVFATISHQNGRMVSFQDAPETYDDMATMRRLNSDVNQAIELGEHITQMERAMGASKEFLSKLVQSDRAQASGVIGTGLDDEIFDDNTGPVWMEKRINV